MDKDRGIVTGLADALTAALDRRRGLRAGAASVAAALAAVTGVAAADQPRAGGKEADRGRDQGRGREREHGKRQADEGANDTGNGKNASDSATATGKRRTPSAQGPCGDGSSQANTCTKNADCCTNSSPDYS